MRDIKYFIWIIAVIVLLIVLIALLIPSGKKSVPGRTLISYSSTNAVAELMIDAPEGADQTHQAVRIDVGQNAVTFEQLAGYNYKIVKQQTFENNQSAYNVFLRALYYAGFNKGNTSSSDTDPNGICPLGDRYIFKMNYGSQTLVDFWATTCGNSTYGGNQDLTVTLFQNQVPNYSNLTQDINF